MDFLEARKQQQAIKKNIFQQLGGATFKSKDAAPSNDESNIYNWGGRTYQRKNGKWEPLSKARSGRYSDNATNRRLNRVGQEYGNKKKEEDPKGRDKKKQEDPKNKDKKQQSQSSGAPVGRHEVAHLTHIKSLIESDPGKAYEIYSQLSPEAQDAVPQDVVNKLVTGHYSKQEGVDWDGLGQDDKQGEEGKDNTVENLNEGEYKLGDKYSPDFDYDGMLEMGANATIDMGLEALQKLYDSFEDVNYHSENKWLGYAIEELEDGFEKKAEKWLKKFNDACKKELGINESLSEEGKEKAPKLEKLEDLMKEMDNAEKEAWEAMSLEEQKSIDRETMKQKTNEVFKKKFGKEYAEIEEELYQKRQDEDDQKKQEMIDAPLGSSARGGGYMKWEKIGKDTWRNASTGRLTNSAMLFDRIGNFDDFKITESGNKKNMKKANTNDLEKGKGHPEGTIKTYGSRKYKKVGGKWKYAGKADDKGKSHPSKTETPKQGDREKQSGKQEMKELVTAAKEKFSRLNLAFLEQDNPSNRLMKQWDRARKDYVDILDQYKKEYLNKGEVTDQELEGILDAMDQAKADVEAAVAADEQSLEQIEKGLISEGLYAEVDTDKVYDQERIDQNDAVLDLIDVEKALDMSKLVAKRVQVTRGGKTFTTTRYVSTETDEAYNIHGTSAAGSDFSAKINSITMGGYSKAQKIRMLIDIGLYNRTQLATLSGATYSQAMQVLNSSGLDKDALDQLANAARANRGAEVGVEGQEDEESAAQKIEEAIDALMEADGLSFDDQTSAINPITGKDVVDTVQDQFTDMIAKGHRKLAMFYGLGGVGKTYGVKQVLSNPDVINGNTGRPFGNELKEYELGQQPGSDGYDFIKFTGKVTPTKLYKAMFEHNGKVIMFDDADSVLLNEDSVNLLKAATDTTLEDVVWDGGAIKDSDGEKIPTRFRFTGRIVIISNLTEKKLKEVASPLLESRALALDVSRTMDETIDKLDRIKHLLPFEDTDGYPIEVDISHREAAINFIKKYANHMPVSQVNGRTLGALALLHQRAPQVGDEWYQNYAARSLMNVKAEQIRAFHKQRLLEEARQRKHRKQLLSVINDQ